jgi:predicted metal-dependent peptidase
MLDNTKEVVDMSKEERRLKKVKIALMRNSKFALWSGILMVGKTYVRDDIDSACTNGRDEIYGSKFIKELDDKELAFVVLHEALHKAYRHLFTWRKLAEEDRELTNAACDYVINLQLVELDPNQEVIAMPMKDGKVYGLMDKKYKGMNTKQVFDALKEEGKTGEDFGGKGFDDHNWEEAKDLTDEVKKELEKEIDQALRSGQIAQTKLHGKGGGGMNRELDDLLNPKIDWREQLRDFVKTICAGRDSSSWRRPNRRYLAGDVYMPSMVSEKIGHIAIGIDTSGSQGSKEIAECLSEVQGIVNEVSPQKIDLVYWDAEVANHEQYEGSAVSNIVSDTKVMGGGGTDPTCMAVHLKEQSIKPECIIQLTDGYIGNWGTPEEWQDVPMLWAIVGGGNAISPVGKTIYIS